MVRGRQFLAARVFETAQSQLTSSIIRSKPNTAAPWVKAVTHIPPAEVLTRPYPVQHKEPKVRGKAAQRPPRHMFRPAEIVHPEDELRQQFYRDHPWELARPMMVLELDGKDARDRDWSKGLRQPGMALSGESVVQRQLYLMEVRGKSRARAYDMARKEFYELQQQEEIERRIALEEARMYGAYFGKSDIHRGMRREDILYEHWKKWAAEQIAKLAAQRSQAYTNVVDVGEGAEDEEDVDVLM
ncbi:mitochondrial ribosomal protein [Parathielavia hyrcaniae]|uniref:37S ribosomal protein S25, mitochondrial n=1 Tax=Parathielavia hyrcaniae TaxID=113614 RepID=A0AAN6Q1P6_9PEZI|nr:mitochondrial ribosomal protein [Parathielavia hyrcaniae]